MPVIFFIGVIVCYPIWTVKEAKYTKVFCKYHRKSCCIKFLLFPIMLIWWLFLLCIVIILSALATSLAVIPAYGFIITIFIISFFRFFCVSKKSKQTEEQKKLVEARLEIKR